MKQKYFLIFVIIGAISVIFVNQYIRENRGKIYTKTAQPLFQSKIAVGSEDDVKVIFDVNSEEIVTKTIEFVSKIPNDEFRRYKQLLETKRSLFQYLTVEYKAWSDEAFWIPNTDENYVVKIPLVSEDENWIYENGKVIVIVKTCNDPTESISINSETGEEYCNSGIKETKKEVKKLRYIVTFDGIVHFAGIY
ncbi:MAG TPA: hypothetical protein VMW09_03445 [Desulfatiglandales bacterium]|nr:hypothetical protein [Desulfatiglandales bacterium]